MNSMQVPWLMCHDGEVGIDNYSGNEKATGFQRHAKQ